MVGKITSVQSELWFAWIPLIDNSSVSAVETSTCTTLLLIMFLVSVAIYIKQSWRVTSICWLIDQQWNAVNLRHVCQFGGQRVWLCWVRFPKRRTRKASLGFRSSAKVFTIFHLLPTTVDEPRHWTKPTIHKFLLNRPTESVKERCYCLSSLGSLSYQSNIGLKCTSSVRVFHPTGQFDQLVHFLAALVDRPVGLHGQGFHWKQLVALRLRVVQLLLRVHVGQAKQLLAQRRGIKRLFGRKRIDVQQTAAVVVVGRAVGVDIGRVARVERVAFVRSGGSVVVVVFVRMQQRKEALRIRKAQHQSLQKRLFDVDFGHCADSRTDGIVHIQFISIFGTGQNKYGKGNALCTLLVTFSLSNKKNTKVNCWPISLVCPTKLDSAHNENNLYEILCH